VTLEKWSCTDRDGNTFVFVNAEPVLGQNGWLMPASPRPSAKKVWKYRDHPDPEWHLSKRRLPVYRWDVDRYERTGRVNT